MAHHSHSHAAGQTHSERGFFDERARKWDERPGAKEMAAKMLDVVRSRAVLDKSKDLMDFGAGTGLLSLPAVSSVRSVLCVDQSSGMCEVVEEKIKDQKLDNACSLVASSLMDMEGQSFDIVVSSMVLHHVSDVVSTLWQLHRLLREGGRVVLFDLAKSAHSHLFHDHHAHKHAGVSHHGGFASEEMSGMLAEAGFEDVLCDVPLSREKKVKSEENEDEEVVMSFGLMCASGTKQTH